MKRSNLLLLILSVVLLSGLIITDHLLALQYYKTNLDDPYKNFYSIPVQSFKALKVAGGNGYMVQVIQGKVYGIRVMNSRKGMFKMETLGDTLSVTFSVANQTYQRPEVCAVGLIITVPKLSFIKLSGTNNEVGPLLQDSLTVQQDRNTITRFNKISIDHLSLQAGGISYFDFNVKNQVKYLTLKMQNTAVVNLNQVSFEKVMPYLQDSAAIMPYSHSLKTLMHPAVE